MGGCVPRRARNCQKTPQSRHLSSLIRGCSPWKFDKKPAMQLEIESVRCTGLIIDISSNRWGGCGSG